MFLTCTSSKAHSSSKQVCHDDTVPARDRVPLPTVWLGLRLWLQVHTAKSCVHTDHSSVFQYEHAQAVQHEILLVYMIHLMTRYEAVYLLQVKHRCVMLCHIIQVNVMTGHKRVLPSPELARD